MIQKKICLLGAFGVGKTSLVSRFVKSIFSDRYYTTIGVKIEKKTVRVSGQQWNLIIWDLAGEDEFMQIRMSYLRGASGYLLVVDGTRSTTFAMAKNIQQRVQESIGHVPFVLLLNKSDLLEEWEAGDNTIKELLERGWSWVKTSAKTGAGVEEAFQLLTGKMMEV
jgi:small GTP-binding protein